MLRTKKNNLQKLRLAKRFTKGGLSAITGVNPKLISYVERFDFYPDSEEDRQRLAEALEVTETEIWYEKKEIHFDMFQYDPFSENGKRF